MAVQRPPPRSGSRSPAARSSKATACPKPRRWPPATGWTCKGFTGTIGLPVPRTEIAIRDDDGKDVPLGESGEICIRGPQVMAGYWQRPDETANVMTADGFFKSGDVGIMDENGYVRIVDRKKDMVLVSGFNVYPSEIEEVAMKCPGVMEAAVIGVPDEHSGEVPKIFIVKKDPNLTEAQVHGFPQGKPHRLQAAEVHRVPRRPAEDPGGQDPAPRTAAEVSLRLSGRRSTGGGHFCFVRSNPTMRSFLTLLAGLLLAASAHALSLADISGKDANGGLKEALTQGAGKAVDLLGKKDGFLGNPKVKIPLPESVQKVEGVMRGLGMGKQADELVKP
jgi:hypothetical protein